MRRRPPSPQLTSALAAAGRGLRVFPCIEATKRPLVAWGSAATTDPDQVRSWWSGPWESANVAVVVPAGVVVVDVDPRHGGHDTLEELEAAEGTLPATLTCVTGSGGFHLWFTASDADELRQGTNVLGPGVDTRCAGRGMVVIPPSISRDRHPYRWAAGRRDPVGAPDWLISRMAKPPRQAIMVLPTASPVAARSRYGERALADEAARVAAAAPGGRNEALRDGARRMGQLVVAGHLDAYQAAAALIEAGRAAGLGDAEIEPTVRSGMRFGVANPRGRS